MTPDVKKLLDKYLPFTRGEKDINGFFYVLRRLNKYCDSEIRNSVLDNVKDLMLLRYFVRKAEKHNARMEARELYKQQKPKKKNESKQKIHLIYIPMGGQNKKF